MLNRPLHLAAAGAIAALTGGVLSAPATSVEPGSPLVEPSSAPVERVALREPQGTAAAKKQRKKKIVIRTMSTRNDMVSGGDVRVSIKPMKGVKNRTIRVFLNGRNVSKRFNNRRGGRYEAYLTKLKLGKNVLVAKARGNRRGRLILTNHPNGGPIFSGPQFPFYQCQETARDRDCNEPATYSFLYKSTNPLTPDLQPYSRSNPPSDVATTTTDNGRTVPFIVRREDGYQDRDRYSILVLFDPSKPWKRFKPQRQFVGKILVTHGGGCGASYSPGSPRLQDYSGTIPEGTPGIEPSYVNALGQGFGVIATALNNTGHNCNVAMNAESVMMAKERFVEQYGNLRYTIGTGCSGGSIAQHTVANAYPGIYQGLITTCSYPDVMTAGAQFADYNLMRQYFEQPQRWAPGVLWNPVQIAQVEGHITPINAIVADEGLYKAALNPEHDCPGVDETEPGNPLTRYSRDTNPTGIRCSVLDLLIKNLGARPRADWNEQEQAAGRGFGGVPIANDGLMYGLEALKAGQITTAQFVDLNVKIGGLDVDSRRIDERTSGDAASIARAYRTGLVNDTGHMDDVAIINFGGPDPGIAHDYAHAFWTEERMLREHGHTDNRVMWFGVTPLIGDPRWANEALDLMDKWLNKVARDNTNRSLQRKIAINRPADVTDRCSNVPPIGEVPGPDGEIRCVIPDPVQLRLSTPREVAGDDLFNDRLACRLRPLTEADFDFLLVPMTGDQFSTMQEVFPNGVCDFSKPGRGQQGAQTWLGYSKRNGDVFFGGRNLPKPAPFSAEGWVAKPFRGMVYPRSRGSAEKLLTGSMRS